MDNSSVYNSRVYNNSRVDNSSVDNSRVDNSSVDNSSVDNSSVYNNSRVDNSRVDNSRVYNSRVDNSSELDKIELKNSKSFTLKIVYKLTLVDEFIKYGCVQKTVKEWKKWLISGDEIETKRDNPKFKLIKMALELAFEQYEQNLNK